MIRRLLSALVIATLIAGCGSGARPSGASDSATAAEHGPAPVVASDCPGTHIVALDIPGPGRPTPEEAVAPYAKGAPETVKKTSRNAVVHDLGPEGELLRIFQVSKHKDGWWPDGYTECAP